MTTLKDVGERGLVRIIRDAFPSNVLLGPGDDAAAIDFGDNCLVACSDLVTLSKHCPPGMSYEDFGWMAVAVNLSDIASMGATPIGFLSSLALPENMDLVDFQQMITGMQKCAQCFKTPIIGGDTKNGPGLIAGTALGLVPKNQLLTRHGARIGDLVAVTGRLGEAAAGYHSLNAGLDFPSAKEALFRPQPRLREGMELARSGAITSCMDISDGLSTTVTQVTQASQNAMQILWESLPVGAHVGKVSKVTGISEEEMVLHFGGDYELLFTIRNDSLGKIHALDIDFTIIGRVIEGCENQLVKENSIITLGDQGYEHFRH